MATMTAQMTAGFPDMYHGGIAPAGTAWLSQNSRAAWLFDSGSSFSEAGEPDPELGSEPPKSPGRIAWVPDARFIADDGVLLLALHAIQDEHLVALAQDLAPELLQSEFVDLDAKPPRAIDEMRSACAQISSNWKLAVSVYEGSWLESQLPALERYPMQLEVCTVSYVRSWGGFVGPEEAEARGSLNAGWSSVGGQLARHGSALAELRRQGVIRSANAPAGDYAEWLVQQATGGELAPASQKSWDVFTPEGERLQVKSRVVTSPGSRGQRQLSPFRSSWEDFDGLVVVLFDEELRPHKAALIPTEVVAEAARPNAYVNAFRVHATDELLSNERAVDWTSKLLKVVDRGF